MELLANTDFLIGVLALLTLCAAVFGALIVVWEMGKSIFNLFK